MEIGKVMRMTRRQIPLRSTVQTSQPPSSAVSSPISGGGPADSDAADAATVDAGSDHHLN